MAEVDLAASRLRADLPCVGSHVRTCMRAMLVLLVTALAASISIAGDLSPKDLVAQLYQAHDSKHDPLDETALLGRYFDPALLKLSTEG